MSNLLVVFLSGLTIGGLTCLAVQGGLLTALVAQRAEERLEAKNKQIGAALAIGLFLAAKILIHTLLGFGLGFLGSKLQLSLEARIIMAILAGLFMIGTALRIVDIHPIFRYLAIQPPRFVYRLAKNQTRSKSYFAPLILGLTTVLIPCGTTQAMGILAIASGNPLAGAAVMFAFVLGTSPVFFTLGYLATKLEGVLHQYFLRVAAILVAILGLISINTGLTLAGHPFKLNLIEISGPQSQQALADQTTSQNSNVQIKDGVQEVLIKVYPTSYQPKAVIASSTTPIRIELRTGPGYFCTNTLIFPSLGKQVSLDSNALTTVDLGKQPPGNIYYVCGSGMYSGNIVVQ